MNTWAVIKTQGKQHKVSEGDMIAVDKLPQTEGAVSFGEVLLVKGEKSFTVGFPLVAKAKVTAKIVKSFRDKKIRVVKFKSKSHYRRVNGHRQDKTLVKIEKIES